MRVFELTKMPPTLQPAAQVFSSPGKLKLGRISLLTAGATQAMIEPSKLHRFWSVFDNLQIVNQSLSQ
jgi:hypothetical protein